MRAPGSGRPKQGASVTPQDDCIFCAIASGKAPAHKVFEDERVLIFMDLFPVAPGHSLVIPRRHGADIFETEARDLRAVVSQSRPLAEAIRSVFAPDGIAVAQLNGAAAGQTVFHYHMHLIPRMRGDSLQVHSRTPGDPERLAETARRLAAAMGAALSLIHI